MTEADGSLYNEDFYAWTQQQAELLRRGPAAANRLDYDLIAEEIEDLGKSELHTCQSLCEHIIGHLLKIEYSGLDQPVRHWRREIAEWRLQLKEKADAQHCCQTGFARPSSRGRWAAALYGGRGSGVAAAHPGRVPLLARTDPR